MNESITSSVDTSKLELAGEFNIAEGTYQNTMLKTIFQQYRDFSNQLITFRDDVSSHDNVQFQNFYQLGCEMLLMFNSYYQTMTYNIEALSPVSRYAEALRNKRNSFNLHRYSVFGVFDTNTKHQRFDIANFAKRNLKKCLKYEMLYPVMDDYSTRKMPLNEKVKDLKRRENNLKDLLLREMGVDNSIFD